MFSGRISRAGFWKGKFILVCILISFAGIWIEFFARESASRVQIPVQREFGLLNLVVLLFALLLGFMNFRDNVRRLHDLNRPGWQLFIPVYNIYLNFLLYFGPGLPQDNRFGPAPVVRQEWNSRKIVGTIFVTITTCFATARLIPWFQRVKQQAEQQTISAAPSVPNFTNHPNRKTQKVTELSMHAEASLKSASNWSCEDEQNLELVNMLTREKAYDHALKFIGRHEKSCGKFLQMRWAKFNLYKKKKNWDAAFKVVKALIDENPGDKDYWVWRGILYERLGKLNEAAADYEQSLELVPKLKSIPMNLSTIYAKLHHYCQARDTLDRYQKAYSELKASPAFSKQLEYYQQKCSANRQN